MINAKKMIIKFLKANNGDSILISFSDEMDKKRNILIDGGMHETYYNSGENKHGELHYTIENIKKKGEKIDLLILTHIDGDHIGGILSWLAIDKDAYKFIGNVWFNSGKTIAKYFSERENKELNLPLKIYDTNFTSVAQSKFFEKYIEGNNIWDKEIIRCGKDFNQNGIAIQILSPNEVQLENLLKNYKRPVNNYFTIGKKTDWDTDISDFIDEENKPDYKFKIDTSIPNGSSIAFLLTYNKTNFLFLGDAHPEVIVDSLKSLNATKENPIEVEFVKISHHGSCKNTNMELLEHIKTNNYIISTSSESHYHPDKRTLARIIKSNPNATLFFNYEIVRDNILSKKDRKDYDHIKTEIISEYILS